MAQIHDKEFGEVTVRRSHLSRRLKLSIAPNGTLRISMPRYAPLILAKRFLANSRIDIRQLLEESASNIVYCDGDKIGKSHQLELKSGTILSSTIDGQTLYVSHPSKDRPDSREVQAVVRELVVKALRKEAKSYLPRRLDFLARQNGFHYSSVRFSHASTRWGSCSTEKVISLNIALMKLSFDQIDYVILHELTHTMHMNHSAKFWSQLAKVCPEYSVHKLALSREQPSI